MKKLSTHLLASLGTLKGLKLALYWMEYIDLMFNAIKNLGVYYLNDNNLENQKIFINLVLKIEKLLRIWIMWNISIVSKITVLTTLSNSKIVVYLD